MPPRSSPFLAVVLRFACGGTTSPEVDDGGGARPDATYERPRRSRLPYRWIWRLDAA
jgi:hypothetical protein